jgi:hypothetical protein
VRAIAGIAGSPRSSAAAVPVVVPVEQRKSAKGSEIRRNRYGPNSSPILKLSPRIIVFRPFVNQLPKLDVPGSTPVARSS